VEVDDNNLILLDFGNATFAFIEATYCVWAARGPRREFYGSEGTLTVNARGAAVPFEIYREDYELGVGGWMAPSAGGLAMTLPLRLGAARRDWSLAVGVAHLADCILEDGKPVISGELARHGLEIMLAATESGRTGRMIDLETTF